MHSAKTLSNQEDSQVDGDFKIEKISILYIGDNELFEDQFCDGSQLFDVKTTTNPLLAYESLQKAENLPEVIICNRSLIGMSGLQFCEILRKNEELKKIVFILNVSKQMSKEEILASRTVGVDDLIFSKTKGKLITKRLSFLINYRKSTNPLEGTNDSIQYKIPLVKRIFDILVAGTVLVMVSPILLLFIILIRLESKGKVYYKSKRVGTGYKIFDFYKLRSMYLDADTRIKDLKHLNQYTADSATTEEPEDELLNKQESRSPSDQGSSMFFTDKGEQLTESEYLKRKNEQKGSAFMKIVNDPRITKVGAFIRKTSIDELPQLINVLKGDMSIVGNRPLPLYEAEALTSDNWTSRFMAPAGITGLWQVEKRGKGGEMSEEERKQLDNIYAENCSFSNDIKLILRTIPALFQKENV